MMFWQWLCYALDWHVPHDKRAAYDTECKRCGRRLLCDSQGNWFAAATWRDPPST